MRLGDLVERALSTVGITKERVESWVGGPCGCTERQERLNQLGAWASRVLSGKTEKAKEHLESITSQELELTPSIPSNYTRPSDHLPTT